ncbi:MAG: AbrB/MazE/SpoVT family DNA-binding domain-containing protein [Candidatus Eremiobacteraeota bacterium]|nr:AbrB/MazE/SpoVT family DNA-binding domain-containing protein [Candidatus Eremiobacteraeota bacterium]
MNAKIAKYGNSLTVRLPAAIARELDLREGDEVTLRRIQNGIALERPARSRLADRLATVAEREPEVGFGRRVGREFE